VSDRLVPGHWTCVFRWGSADGSDGGHWVANPARGVLNARHELTTILRLNDVAVNPALEPRWRVYVFDLRTVGVMKRVGRRWRHIGQWTAPPVYKLRETARRAVYALGLHFGAVDLGGVHGAVVRVLPDPPLDRRLARAFARAMETYVAATQEAISAAYGWTTGPEIVLGADPEFVLRHRRTGRTVSAARFFSRWGVVGLDRACFKRNGVLIYPPGRGAPGAQPGSSGAGGKSAAGFRPGRQRRAGAPHQLPGRRHHAAPLQHRGPHPLQQRAPLHRPPAGAGQLPRAAGSAP